MWYLDFAGIELLQCTERSQDAAALMEETTAHVQVATSLPLLDIANSTTHDVKRGGLRRAALLGTAFTMNRD